MTNRATTECNQTELPFTSSQSRKVEARFDGGDISSDGGLLLLREVDRKLDVLSRAARLLDDPRETGKVRHSAQSLVKQRVMALAQGYEDLNDHDLLRNDSLLQLAADKVTPLASPPTLCRMEHWADRHSAMRLNKLLVELFIESFDSDPEELILDFDATDDPTHGQQEGVFFHGYYRHYCFLPLYVFCGSHPLFAWLRPSNIDGARGSWAILKMLTKRLREKWPQVRIIFRGDSGFCRWRMLDWCDSNNVDYVVGLARNTNLTGQMQFLLDEAAHRHQLTWQKQRLFTWLYYGAKSWSCKRTVIGKAEHTDQGSNPRYIVTSLKGNAKKIYDTVYCARGDMENRIKEQQLGLFADRTSCHAWWPNQHRLLMSTLAYVLIDGLRRLGLRGTRWATKQAGSLRAELLKIGAVIMRNTRRIRVHLSSSWPHRAIFTTAHGKLTGRA